ncbi:hypothetical protein A9Q84_17035 [Halobacteriovorax marinus]|uniref:Lipoprotein n=1 Tax=Halobacteriovorax marinus TaxID=97084 RepID=A0A1Y5F3I2_9BACT|nr:hypothetical protein A9Q84_17035 [Halobacteriovorax marinus]
MKTLLILLTIASFNTFADDCAGSFSAGEKHNRKAVNYSNRANDSFELSKDEANSSYPDDEIICDALKETVLLSSMSTNQYKSAYKSFRNVTIFCEDSSYRSQARPQERLNKKGFINQKYFTRDVCSTLSNKCDYECPRAYTHIYL